MNEPIVARADAHYAEEGPAATPSPNRKAATTKLVWVAVALLAALFASLYPVFDGDIAGYADAEPLGSADGYVYASECPTPIPSNGTDAAPAIESCVDALTSDGTGGTLYLEDNTYTLATPVDLNTNNRLKVRIEGAGGKNGGTQLRVTGPVGINVGTSSLSTAQGPEFGDFHMVGSGNTADGIRVVLTNHTMITGCGFEGFNRAVTYDNNESAAGSSDAAYNEITGNSYFRNNTVSIYRPNRGGFKLIGGYIGLTSANQTGIWIGSSGYQDQVIGTRIDGTYDNTLKTGTGTGVSTSASGGQFLGMKMESNAVAFDIRGGNGNIVDSYVSRSYDSQIGARVASGASNTTFGAQFTAGTAGANRLVNRSSSTKQVTTQTVPTS